ncbi:PD-(D/E)XK nuclease family protein [Streptomyces sp. SBST2-5]|uniref:PD-(D/E)XK nuclease family protein n=1 Tax=Streptomyces composti TaxID=2720025 RepID=A0ABX1A0Z9_9ACTN|nr:PD-(D/E)XK nuclease family protein [Streptomyces composti]NJP50060.1 PD-(D/E)XK nuclease family protein [Streptomyces composti]
MTSPPELRLPDHISHSSREALERCAKQYFLTRVAKAPQTPALWLAGGSAVHEATENYDLLAFAGMLEDFQAEEVWNAFFDSQLAEAREREENENLWRQAATEPIEVWRRMGLQFVQAYVDWRERSPWEIWTTPDGFPAIELDVSGKLPGCDVEIKAYLDRVFWDPVLKRLVIVDLKTSKRPPKTPAQFETYAALLKAKYDVQADLGAAFMNRRGTLGAPFDLSGVTPQAVGAVYGEAWRQIQGYMAAGNFPADTSDCFLCDVKAACHAQNGPLAHLYDPASPGYPIPF